MKKRSVGFSNHEVDALIFAARQIIEDCYFASARDYTTKAILKDAIKKLKQVKKTRSDDKARCQSLGGQFANGKCFVNGEEYET